MIRASNQRPASETDEANLKPIELTTQDLPLLAQFGAFRESYHGVFDLESKHATGDGFPVHQRIWNLGKLVVTSTRLPGPGHPFILRHAANSTLAHWYFLIRSGSTDPATSPGPALLSLHCLAQSFQVEIEAHRLMVAFIPRDMFPFSFDFDGTRDRALDSGASLLLTDFLVLLERRLPQLRDFELVGVPSVLRSLLALPTAAPAGHSATNRHAANVRLLERAKRLIDRRLREPDLSPDSLAEELCVSRSGLYRAFHTGGGVSTYIRRQRLLRAREALLNLYDTRPVQRIAEQCGFDEASAFSRAFRVEFGMTPRSVRKTGGSKNDIRADPDASRSRIRTGKLKQLLLHLPS